MNPSDRQLQLATRAAQIILENGGEVYRVEETATRFASACGATDPSSFATPTMVILSIRDGDGHILSNARRIKTRTLDLRKVDAVNALSRATEADCRQGREIDLDALERQLDDIQSLPKYPLRLRTLAAALGTAGFALLLGGSGMDCLSTFCVGLLVFLLRYRLAQLDLNDFILNIMAGALTSLLAWLCSLLQIADRFSLVISAAIMLHVPGLALTNAMRDIVAGDLLSGASRLLEALFIALGVALGSGTALHLLLRLPSL